MDLNDVFKLYRNAGDGVYKPYPMKPEIRAKLERQGVQVVYPRRLRRSFPWRRLWALLPLLPVIVVLFLLVR